MREIVNRCSLAARRFGRWAVMVAALWAALAWGDGAAAEADGAKAAGPALASTDEPASDESLRGAIRQYFTERLRIELQLTDDQARQLAPALDALERERRRAARERRVLLRRVQVLLRRGGDDHDFQRVLSDLDAMDDDHRRRARTAVQALDPVLTARQRVQLRLFLDRFRVELAQRIGDAKSTRVPAP